MKASILLPVLSASLLTSCVYETSNDYVAPTSPIKGVKETNTNLRPTVHFPARIAVARVQTRGSQIYLIEDREFDRPEHQQTITSLPQISGIVNIDPGQLDSTSTNYTELRKAAHRLGCNMLAVYRFHSSSHTKDASTLVSVATLGFAPTNAHTTNATVSLTIFDASNGYIYGVSEETARSKSLSTTWGSDNSTTSAAHKAQQEAYDKLIHKLPTFWNSILRKG